MDTATEQNPQQPIRQLRWLGMFMLIAGGVLAYLCIILPLLEASRHEEDVSISRKGVMLAPALSVLGLVLLLMGNERAGQMFGTREKPTVVGLIICIVTAGIGFLVYEWLKSRLRAYGYSI
jgi:hypothetical protein